MGFTMSIKTHTASPTNAPKQGIRAVKYDQHPNQQCGAGATVSTTKHSLESQPPRTVL